MSCSWNLDNSLLLYYNKPYPYYEVLTAIHKTFQAHSFEKLAQKEMVETMDDWREMMSSKVIYINT